MKKLFQESDYSICQRNESGPRAIYYISDIHVDSKEKKKFASVSYEQYIDHVIKGMNDNEYYGDAPLVIAGDISCCSSHVDYFFRQLRMRRDGIIIFILGNHEIWERDEIENRNLPYIVQKYKDICEKYDVILLHNEVAFFYDERTGNGEILQYYHKKIIDADELTMIDTYKLKEYSKRAKLIIYGGVGFSAFCKSRDEYGRLYNANLNLYMDIVPTLKEDIEESKKCEKGYIKILDALENSCVIIATHFPFEDWSTHKYNPNYIYINGHTHHNYFEKTEECTIFADNQIGYYSDHYELKRFYIEGTYDIFEQYQDGIYKITYDQYIDFNIGKNIMLKKKRDGRQIYLLKRDKFYMFVNYNSSGKLILLNGGASKRLNYDIEYYYKFLGKYGNFLTKIMNQYTNTICVVSEWIKEIGGNGEIHGCIVDIDKFHHIYINPIDGCYVPYYAINTEQKYVYKNLETLITENCSLLVSGYQKWKSKEEKIELPISAVRDSEMLGMLVTDKSIYKISRVFKTIQYLIFQNVIRDWNDKIIKKMNSNSMNTLEEINEIVIDGEIFNK